MAATRSLASEIASSDQHPRYLSIGPIRRANARSGVSASIGSHTRDTDGSFVGSSEGTRFTTVE
jgi:hypothetical protein